jgi:hypothetical protein
MSHFVKHDTTSHQEADRAGSNACPVGLKHVLVEESEPETRGKKNWSNRALMQKHAGI